ncbi:MAG: hypothetical protein BroJett021_01720 [Chloroflexota bacterium]|nr:MAG: hypothetical protein BroJett021_01720 [Chloroflexota bacterium]
MLIALLVVLLLCIGPFMIFNGLGGGEDSQVAEQPAQVAAPVIATPRPVQQSQPTPVVNLNASGDPGQTWLIMLYQDADDKILEKDIFIDLNEAERVGSNDQVRIVSQIDRYRGGFDGDGNWHGARRYYVTRDDDLMRLGSELIEDLGEVNMANGDTLVDFVKWAVASYPSDKYVLILSDHGMGWPGGWSDPDPGNDRSRASVRAPIVDALGNQMFLAEIDDALARARTETGIDKFELIGMDACLMGHIEVLSALAEHANYAVLSQETEPALGWAYASFLSALQQNPGIDGGQLGQVIVSSYIDEDARITDEQQRLDLYGRAGGFFGMGSVPSARETAAQMARNVTLAALDLRQTPALLQAINEYAHVLQNVNQRDVAKARSYAQSFTSIFGANVPASYIDLGHFINLVLQVGDGATASTGRDVLSVLDAMVLADKKGSEKSGATGVSIYFPNSQLYKSPVAGPTSYTAVADRFAQDSLWDDFLAFHYTGRRFEPSTRQLAAPEAAAVRAPAAGGITVGAVEKSDDVAAPGRPITLRMEVDGSNVGYIYIFTGYYDRSANSIYVADQDYLESGDTRELNGVYYPEWGEGPFVVEFEWEPLMFAIDDGVNRVTVALQPESYGATYEDAVYSVDGVYTYAADGEQRRARLYFRDGVFQQVFGFAGDGSTGAPREILPQVGDTFTVDEQWLDLDNSGRVVGRFIEAGGVLTFGREPMRWVELDAAVGDYVVGFIVEDLDGNKQEIYTEVRVE